MRSAGTISFPLLLLAACSSAPLVDDSPRASVEDSTQPAATPVATSQDDDPLDGAAARQEARREARALIVQMHLEEAGRLKENGRLKDAAREVAGALELAPDDARVQNLAAEIAALLGDPNGDFRTVSRILTDEWQLRMQQLKADTEDLLDRGKLALSRQDFDQAVAELSLAAVSVARAPQGVDWGGMDAEIESLLEQAKSERVAQAEAVRDAAEKAAIAELRAAREAEQARQQAIVQNMVDEAAAAFNARDYDDAVGYAEEALAMDAKNEQAFEIREAAFKAGRDRASEDYIREKTEQFARWREHLAEMEIPWTDTVTLPGREQWRALTELRSKRRGLDLSTKVSPAEQALRESLSKTTVVLPGIEGEEEITPLIQIIADYTQLPIIVDPMAEDAVSSAGAVFDINFPNPITVEQALDFLTEVGGEEVTITVS